MDYRSILEMEIAAPRISSHTATLQHGPHCKLTCRWISADWYEYRINGNLLTKEQAIHWLRQAIKNFAAEAA